MKAISDLQFEEALRIEPHLMIYWIDIMKPKCNDTHKHYVKKGKLLLELFGTTFWDVISIDWHGYYHINSVLPITLKTYTSTFYTKSNN